MAQESNPTGRPEDRKAANEAAALNQAFPAPKPVERRQAARLKYQVVATLEPVATNGPEDVKVVTRDASTSGTGFVSAGSLPEGSRAVLHLPDPNGDGEPQRIECRVRRSREIGNGLFEGSVEFVGAQPQFSDTRIRPTTPRRAN
jgi:c-di-GMP-binding flagellar brake protein YcgR